MRGGGRRKRHRVAEWLCGRVGDTGSVVATDVDTRFLESLEAPNLQVRKHDIVHQALERDRYDLVHVRLLLMHLGDDRAAALAHMADAVKPGGWLLAEEQDNVTAGQVYPPDRAQERVGMGPWKGGGAANGRPAVRPEAAGDARRRRHGGRRGRWANEAAQTGHEGDGHGDAVLSLPTRSDHRDGRCRGGRSRRSCWLRMERPAAVSMMAPLIVAAWGRKPFMTPPASRSELIARR